jgi:hypothetical protein
VTTNEDGTVTLTKDEAKRYENLRLQAFLDSCTPISRSGESKDPTWRGWLRECMASLISSGDGFSGKRPLGNSGWLNDLIECLAEYDLTVVDLLAVMFPKAAL